MANKLEQGNDCGLFVKMNGYLIIYKPTDVQKS